MLKSLTKTFENNIVVDIETTGLDYKSDEIIELAALRIACTGEECQVEREIDTLICLSPGEILPVEITKLTSIDEQMDLMTVKEASELWGITTRRVQVLCNKGKVKGTTRLGNIWVIPKGTPKPIDGRAKAAKTFCK